MRLAQRFAWMRASSIDGLDLIRKAPYRTVVVHC